MPIAQAGLTLVELMVAMTLGLLLLIVIGTIYVGSAQTYRVQDDQSRLQETGRTALEMIGRSIRQAGYANIGVSPVDTKTGFGGTAITGTDCSSGAQDTLTIQYDGTAGDRTCGNDLLTSTDEANAHIVQASFFYHLDTTTPTPTPQLRCIGQHSTTPSAAADCTTSATTSGVPLLDDIEDLQFLYGVDNDGDQTVDQYTSTPTWSQVISVKVCVLVRSENTGIVSGAAQRYLNCNGALGLDALTTNDFTTATDSRLRRAFVATFNLRNRVSNVPW